jgi:CDP-diacylglycerol--glycerol-3-phosphate 3-phosphatidyltransferase
MPATDPEYRDRILTIPNVICLVRLAGALSLFYFAWAGNAAWFLAMFVILNVSDWIDGRLARWLHQRSDFGARLDSLADAVLYGALFWGVVWLRWDVVQRETPWWAVCLASYALTCLAGWWKFGRPPSYHTYGAKASQWFVLIGAICLMLDYSHWPFRIAMAVVTLTNLEATAITWMLPQWRADVLSLWHALEQRRVGN